jgi:hypothetical protein
MGRDYADKLVQSANVVKLLNADNCRQIPANEAQARPLTKLDTPELQQQAWEKIAERMGISRRRVGQVLEDFGNISKMNIATAKGKKSKVLKKTKAKIKEEKIEHVEQTLEKELGRKPTVRKSEAVH